MRNRQTRRLLFAGMFLLPLSASAQLVINEIMQNPAAVADGSGEWLELHNPGASDIDINGWSISDNDSETHLIDNGGPLLVPAGGYLLLGNNTDAATNGGVPVAYGYGGSWFLANGADEVVLTDDSSNEIDRVEYDGGPVFPDPNGASMALRAPDLDNNVGENWCTSTTPYGGGDLGSPGAANSCDVVAIEQRFIHEVQGSGPSVNYPGSPVEVEAVVIAAFQGNGGLDGFFIQEEDVDADADASTSEGIFVYCGACLTDVAEGDLVRVIGTPSEFFAMSQLDVTSASSLVEVVVPAGTADNLSMITPSVVVLPAPAGTDEEATFEHLEGMLVEFAGTLVATEYFQLARYGIAVLSVTERLRQFTDYNAPSVPGYAAHLADIATRRIILDDLNNDQNIDPVFHPQPGGFAVDNFFRGGNTVESLTGVLHWSFSGSGSSNAWRVRPTAAAPVEFVPSNPRTAQPVDVGGRLKVASMNVLNYFDTIDTGAPLCGPTFMIDCRGAHSQAELDRQTHKIVSALAAMDADIVGLVEIENNASTSLQTLTDALNAALGARTYDYLDTGTIGTDAIKVAFIYKLASVETAGGFAVLDSMVAPDFIDTKNRPVLVQTFAELSTGQRLTVAVNHFKSKGSDCKDVGDPDLNDGQGNCNGTRDAAAKALVHYLATDPTGSGDEDFLVIGDLNSYALEDPIETFRGAGYLDLLNAYEGSDAYSYVFDGQWGYLDHALASPALVSQVTGATAWHINADEVNLLDYNDTIRDAAEASFEAKPPTKQLYAPDAYRSSDHDPVIVGLDLSAEPASRNACKKGGWQALSRDNGSPFRNQGQCIKYLNTGR